MNYKTSMGRHIQIKAIVAMDKNGVIGYDNDLIFHNADDLQMFKAKTMNHLCVMGSKTFLSIGRILPNRQTVIVTHKADEIMAEVDKMKLPKDTPKPITIQANSGKSLSKHLFELAQSQDDATIWICGGAKIYDMLRPYIKTWIVTSYQIDVASSGVAYGLLPDGYNARKLVCIDHRFPGIYGMMDKGVFITPNNRDIDYVVRSFTKDMMPPPSSHEEKDDYAGIIGRRYLRRKNY